MSTMLEVDNFLTQLQRNLDQEIDAATEKLRLTLWKKITKNKALSKSITEAQLTKACKNLKQKVASNFKANFDIFDFKQIVLGQIQEKFVVINKLQSTFEELQSSIVSVTHLHQQTEALHNHLTKVLYALRVGAQAFEEFDVHPINRTMAELLMKKHDLSRLIGRSDDALNKLALSQVDDMDDSLDAFIDMDDEEATKALNKSLFS